MYIYIHTYIYFSVQASPLACGDFYFNSGQNLSVTATQATMNHSARGRPVGDARVAEGVSRDASVRQAPHRCALIVSH